MMSHFQVIHSPKIFKQFLLSRHLQISGKHSCKLLILQLQHERIIILRLPIIGRIRMQTEKLYFPQSHPVALLHIYKRNSCLLTQSSKSKIPLILFLDLRQYNSADIQSHMIFSFQNFLNSTDMITIAMGNKNSIKPRNSLRFEKRNNSVLSHFLHIGTSPVH